MRMQKGFVSLIGIFLVVLVIGIAGGGYVIFNNNQQQKRIELTNQEQQSQDEVNSSDSTTTQEAKSLTQTPELVKVETTNQEQQNSQPIGNSDPKATSSVPPTTSQSVAPLTQTKEPVKIAAASTSPSTDINTKQNCDGDWECLISAAMLCKSTSATISFDDIPVPFSELIASSIVKYEIKKLGSDCGVVSLNIRSSVTFSEEARAAALLGGSTNAELDAQLEVMNDNLKKAMVEPTLCVASGSSIASYLTDQKSRSMSVNINGLDVSGGEYTLTTSTGQKLTCSQ